MASSYEAAIFLLTFDYFVPLLFVAAKSTNGTTNT